MYSIYKIIYQSSPEGSFRDALVLATSKASAQKLFLSTWAGDMRDKIKIDVCAQSSHTVFLLD